MRVKLEKTKNGLVAYPCKTHKDMEEAVILFAFYDEKHPNADPQMRKHYAGIRKKHAYDCLQWGKCEVCGTEDLLGEYGLTWICDKPACEKQAKKDTDACIAEFHKRQRQSQKGG